MKNVRSKVRGFNIMVVVVMLLLIVGYPAGYYLSSDTISVTVTNKERITTGSGENISSKYLIYTENEVFQNTDSWMFFKFSSMDLQNDIKKDSTYNVKVAGWRIPFFSMNRNIISIND